MKHWHIVGGTLRYEFRMQVRRWSVWLTLVLVSSITFLAGANEWHDLVIRPGRDVAILWALHANFLLPVGFGIILADRLVRDRRTKFQELLSTLPGSFAARLWGKYLGCALATILPLFLIYLCGLGYVFSQSHDSQVFWWALPAFAAINLPGLLCIGAFSMVLPILIWVPLYQFLFTGYYLWGNDLPLTLGVPTLSHTLLTPVGEYRAGGFFGINDPTFHASLQDALFSTLLMLVGVVVAVVGGSRYLAWQQARA
jgi:hypothetical protein